MVFNEVLEVAFDGCGLSFSDVRNSRRFRAAVERAKFAYKKFPCGTDLGDLLRAGPVISGALLNRFSISEAAKRASSLSCWEVNPEVLASLELLGTAIVNAAKTCLPTETFKRPPEWHEKEPDFLSESCKLERLTTLKKKDDAHKLPMLINLPKLARSWKGCNADERYKIGKLLTFMIRDHKDPNGELEYSEWAKGLKCVLPKYYGKWIPGVGNGSNCLGKAQLVAGFADMANATSMCGLPLQMLMDLMFIRRGQAAEKILAFYDGTGFPLKDHSRKSLEQIVAQGLRLVDEPRQHHMAVAFKLQGKNWMLLDPNLNIQGMFEDEDSAHGCYEQLRDLREILPGHSCLRTIGKSHARYDNDADLVNINCGHILPLARQVMSRKHTKEEIIDLIVNSEFLDNVTTLQEFLSDLPRNASRRKKAICVLLEFMLQKYEKRTEEKPILRPRQICTEYMPDSDDEDDRFLWFVFCTESEEYLSAHIKDDEHANEMFWTMVLGWCAYPLKRMIHKTDHSFGGKHLQHPFLEFSDLRFGLAVATLSHVALDMGFQREVEEVLFQHSFHMRELVHLASSRIREESDDHFLSPSALVSVAHSALESIPTKSLSAKIVLDAQV